MELVMATPNEINALHSKFNKFNIHLLEDPRKLFDFVGIMDVFNCVLNEEEASELLGADHHIKHGSKFVSTFRDLMDCSGQGVYVQLYKKAVGKAQKKYVLSCLSRNEAKVFRKLFSNNKGIYKVGDHEAIVFLTKLSVNELVFANFFFPSLDLAVIGNYDLSFPVYSKTFKGFSKCREAAQKNSLFIRQ